MVRLKVPIEVSKMAMLTFFFVCHSWHFGGLCDRDRDICFRGSIYK